MSSQKKIEMCVRQLVVQPFAGDRGDAGNLVRHLAEGNQQGSRFLNSTTTKRGGWGEGNA